MSDETQETGKRPKFNRLDNLSDIKRNMSRAIRKLQGLRIADPNAEGAGWDEGRISLARLHIEQTKVLVGSLKALAEVMRGGATDDMLERLNRLEGREKAPEAAAVQ